MTRGLGVARGVGGRVVVSARHRELERERVRAERDLLAELPAALEAAAQRCPAAVLERALCELDAIFRGAR